MAGRSSRGRPLPGWRDACTQGTWAASPGSVKPLCFCILCASSCALDEYGGRPDPAKSLKKRQIAAKSPKSPVLAYHLLVLPRGFVSLEVGMRGFTVGLAVVMFSALALGQVGTRGIPGCQ